MSTPTPPSPPLGPFQQLSVGMNYGYDGFCATSTSGQEWCWGEVARQPLACAVESDGVCIATDPVVCPVADQCHAQGVFDPLTRRCSTPVAPDGTACSDGNACTQADTCQAGVCAGADPVVCTTWDTCQTNTCDPKTGQCVSGSVPDGTACDDGNACTQGDTCFYGWCSSGMPVECPMSDNPCVYGSMCDPMTGQCAPSSVAYNGSYCDDGNGCTLNDSCQNGVCTDSDPVMCAGEGDCYQAGTCDPAVGRCTYPAKSEGASCDDRNPCTQGDTCQAGACIGTPTGGTCQPASSSWLAAGDRHNCALRPDGTIACWGQNYFGQSTPPTGTFKQVTAGRWFSCALRTDGTPQCWGTNEDGQTNPRPGPYTQMASGMDMSCGLTAAGQTECWGRHYNEWPSGTFTQIALGGVFGCGLRTNGSITCWGDNTYGQSTPPAGTGYRKVTTGQYHSCALDAQGSAVCWGDLPGMPIPPGAFIDVAAGFWQTCGLRGNGTVACWGQTHGSPPPGSFVAISVSTDHSCAMRGDGSVACWGVDDSGQATAPIGTFTQVTTGSEFCGLAADARVSCWGRAFPTGEPTGSFIQIAGGATPCGIRTDGSIACWDIDPIYGWRMQYVPSGTFTQLSVGDATACAVRDNGGLDCWGELIGNSIYEMPATNDFVEVEVGGGIACARRNTGAVTCWGNHDQGTPSVAFAQLSVGQWHACGLKADGSIACWGSNSSGQASPPAGNDFVQVASQGSRSCALDSQGSAICWGEPLGGDVFGISSRIGPLVQIALGYNAACGLNANGQELCWGQLVRQPL
jgi:alpha-tubulin suppressor-like RCC1 family protein